MIKRPSGITLVSVILFVLGFFSMILIALTLGFSQQASFVSILIPLLIGLTTFIASIGLLKGKVWGWWIAASFSILMVSSVANTIISYLLFKSVLSEIIERLPILIIILLVLVFSLFSKKSMEHFGFSNEKRNKVIKIFCVITIVFFLFITIRNFAT